MARHSAFRPDGARGPHDGRSSLGRRPMRRSAVGDPGRLRDHAKEPLAVAAQISPPTYPLRAKSGGAPGFCRDWRELSPLHPTNRCLTMHQAGLKASPAFADIKRKGVLRRRRERNLSRRRSPWPVLRTSAGSSHVPRATIPPSALGPVVCAGERSRPATRSPQPARPKEGVLKCCVPIRRPRPLVSRS